MELNVINKKLVNMRGVGLLNFFILLILAFLANSDTIS